jgi:murein DD-endopeptidase MepM/ murein hydrolase activator NlpD
MFKRFIATVAAIAVLFSFSIPAAAQSTDGPVYIVQSGDTLSLISSRFNVDLDELMNANDISNPNLLAAGQELVIPGLEGISGVLVTEFVQFGDSFRSLSRRTQIDQPVLRKLNRLVSPSELYVGVSMIVPQPTEESRPASRVTPSRGESLLELAVKSGTGLWELARANGLGGTWDAIPGDVLYTTGSESEGTANGLPAVFTEAVVSPLPIEQGATTVIRVQVPEGVTVSGMLLDHALHFFEDSESAPHGYDSQVALQGVHALLEPGAYPLRLEATLPDGSKQSFEQNVLVLPGNYIQENILVNDPATIDPSVTLPEEEQIRAVVEAATPQRYWDGIFQSPSVYQEYTSFYGNRRTYIVQNSETTIQGFHTGLDFAGGEGLQIVSPAPGKVVFAGPLTVRGNATIVDHGWGVYSGFWHQSKIDVQVGDKVEAGQVIGIVGGTGRVTGAHLHWEIWVNGVQVNPFDWLQQEYPQ